LVRCGKLIDFGHQSKTAPSLKTLVRIFKTVNKTKKHNNMKEEFDRTSTEGSARYFQNCVRNGDLESALDCFDEDAVYITGIGEFVTGKENIRKALEQVCALKPDLQALRSTGFTVGAITAWVDEWTLKAILPDGTKLDMKGTSSDILKKQPNGNWVYLVDNPYGAEYLHL